MSRRFAVIVVIVLNTIALLVLYNISSILETILINMKRNCFREFCSNATLVMRKIRIVSGWGLFRSNYTSNVIYLVCRRPSKRVSTMKLSQKHVWG